jgi:hypothetical protein
VARKRSTKAMEVDFTGTDTEIRQRAKHIPPGNYMTKIVGWKKKYKDNDKSNAPYISWRFQITEGKHKGTPLFENTSLSPDALFNLRNLIFAATDGKKNVAGKKIKFNPDNLVGKAILCVVEDDEWNNKIRSVVADVRPPSEAEEEEEEDEEEEDEEEEEEEDEDEDEEDEDEDEEDDDEDLDEVDVDEI